MAEEEQETEEPPKKGAGKPLLIGLILALALGGGGFYAAWSGLILGSAGEEKAESEPEKAEKAGPLPDVAFIEVPPLVINIGSGNLKRHLRFRAQLEVEKEAEPDVAQLMPRIVDVLNGYLRAIETGELERKTALVRLRAQMLRRIQVVTGEGRVRDLLVMEFVLN